MSEELIPEQLSLDEQIDNQLVKANVTEAVIADLRERYLPLKIAGIEDKETYLIVKEGRKNCKAIRVMAKKVCADGREEAVAIQKKWVAKEKEVTSRIAEVEDYLEEQEKAYEAEVAKEKEARKRLQEEQLINRQQHLFSLGAKYSDGVFILGEVSFDLAAIKESDEEIWVLSIRPIYEEEYNKLMAEQLKEERLREEKESELKRQQEKLEEERQQLAKEAARLKEEADRQAAALRKALEEKWDRRMQQLTSVGLYFDPAGDQFKGYDCFVSILDIKCYSDEKWAELIQNMGSLIEGKKAEEAEEKRKEQEKIDTHRKRFAELLPYKNYQPSLSMVDLWNLSEEEYQKVLFDKKTAYDLAEEEKNKKIAEEAAKAERERIEEEQRQADAKRIRELREFRISALSQYNMVYNGERGELGTLSEDQWWSYINDVKATFEEIKRQQEEERKAEELAKAGEKVKWANILSQLSAIEIPKFMSGQYARKAAILREKLEEIKAL